MEGYKILRPFVIGIDATNIRRGGGRTHLIELLSAADPVRDSFSEVVVWASKETLLKLPNYPWLTKQWSPALDGNLIRRIFWQKFSLAKFARKADCNVLFVPGGSFSTSFQPVVAMSQNILPFEWPELRRFGFSMLTLRLVLLRITQSRSFRVANGVIFLTNYAKNGVLRVTGPLKGETSIIPHGLNPRFLVSEHVLSSREQIKADESVRLIYISIIDQYKHQWHVVEGVAKARAQSGLDLQLDLIGPAYPPALRKLNAAIAKHDPKGQWASYRGAIDYQELHALYAKAHIGVWASTCETFGLILLETMAAGLPVLSSDRGPTREILGDAGLYFDPEQPDDLCRALLELLGSAEKMRILGRAAHAKALAYSWERCADKTFGFLRQVAEALRDKESIRDAKND
jgi:glycosyltransferase involved in cell wall biosynthesis